MLYGCFFIYLLNNSNSVLGVVAHLVEHPLGVGEARGSKPCNSNSYFFPKKIKSLYFKLISKNCSTTIIYSLSLSLSLSLF